MSKNKLVWNIALVFLIAIISLPIAYAQVVPKGSQLYFLLINAAIIFVVLFALQSFLIPGKPDKERTAVWVIIIFASLLLAYLFGRTGLLWAEGQPLARFFSIYVLVNAIIIGAVLYFLLGFILKDKVPKSPEGIGGYGILIFLVALIFAVKIGNQWIWNLATIIQLRDYLFGAEGILNPSPPAYRLFTFLITAALLAFFFTGYLITNVPGGNRINWALAILIAATVARAGIQMQSVVILGEVIFLIVLAKAMSGTVPQPKNIPTHWIASAFLVGWASAAMTYGTEYQGILAWFVGTPLYYAGLISAGPAGVAARPTGTRWFGWIAKMGLGALLLMLFLFLPLFIIMRGETRKRAITLAVGEAKKRLNAILKFTRLKRATPEGREPSIFRENRHLFQALANYTTRSEITYRYWGFVIQGQKVGESLASIIGKFGDQKLLRKDIIAYRSGGVTSEGEHAEGWNRLNLEVVALVNELFELLYRTYISAELGFKPFNTYKIESAQLVSIERRARELLRKISLEKEHYDFRAKAYGAHHALRAYRDVVLNMTNVTGDVLENPQKFARRDAEFEASPCGPALKAGWREEHGIIVPIHQVNQYGELIDDIRNQRDEYGNLLADPRKYKKPRKLKNPEDIIDYPNFTQLMENVGYDWKGLAEDIRYGLHHPKSRTVKMYIKALDSNVYPEFADEQITPISTKVPGPPGTGDQAFDMRALADPGKNVYWGRAKFDDDSIKIPRVNPYPILSSLGLAYYLETRVRRDVKPPALAEEYLRKYPRDTAAPKKDLKAGFPIGMRLGEKPPEPKEQGG